MLVNDFLNAIDKVITKNIQEQMSHFKPILFISLRMMMRKITGHIIAVCLLAALISGCDSGRQSHYVRYLHRYMTTEDERAYKPEFWEENVAKTLEIRDRVRRSYPRKFFKHFILPVRVANEPLDRFRLVYADSLCSLVDGMEPEEAVIAINTWCRYRAYFLEGWDKMQSAMGTMEYGYGLCSDLNVLTVNAMRAAGFPARQVSTTWSDFRSNHTWVEVYVNDHWAMMSASEPYPKLDTNAWLNTRRVMEASIDVFGNYRGPETVLSRDRHITSVSNLSKYASVKDVTVSVYDSDGRPVKGAQVQLLMYHEGGIRSLATAITGIRGRATVETGLGDVIVFAYKGGKYGMARLDGTVNGTGVLLSHDIRNSSSAEFKLSPPPREPGWRYIKSNDDAWAPLDSVRLARIRAFPADTSLIQSFMDEPRRCFLPEVKWPVMGNTLLTVLCDSAIVWGKELSIYKMLDGDIIPVNRIYVSPGTYLAVTGTALSVNDDYNVRLEIFQIPDSVPEKRITVSMPSLQ